MHPTELICSVRPEQVEAARFLLAATVRVAVDGGGVLALGATIANPPRSSPARRSAACC